MKYSSVVSQNNIVIDFISKLTTAMNTRYNTTLFILQQEYIQTHVYKGVSKYITTTTVFTYYMITIREGVNTSVNY